MGLLYDGRILITDASNVPVSGGKVRVYDAGTTNPSSLFSDASLSTPLANPVVANSAGITPQIFAADGLLVDIQYLTSADASIANRGYEDVSFLGSSTGDLSRTVTGDGRFTITGSAGAVLFRVGDPSPDNTGGTLTIEGWAGTQGDTLTLDFALVNVTGRFKEQGKKLQGTVYTEATTFSAAANQAIALTNDPDGVTTWDIDVWNYSQSGSDDLILQISYDGGATYKSGASDYAWVRGLNGSTSGAASGTSLTASSIQLMSGAAGAANKPASFRIRVYTPNSGNNCTTVSWTGEGVSATEHVKVSGMGYGGATFGRATHVRLDTSGSNTISGSYRVVPLRGFGET
jgi:hypothetical protein